MQNCASSVDHPQVARQRQLEAGADGVALDRGDRDEPRIAQEREALLVAVDRRRHLVVAQGEQPGDRLLPVTRRRGPASRGRGPAEKDWPSARGRRRRDVVADRRRRSGPAPATSPGSGRCATSGRSSVIVATAPSTSYRRPACGELLRVSCPESSQGRSGATGSGSARSGRRVRPARPGRRSRRSRGPRRRRAGSAPGRARARGRRPRRG